MAHVISTEDKRLFWREFWFLWFAGLIADAIIAAVSNLPVSPIANYLFVKGDVQKPVLIGVALAETIIELTIIVGLGLAAAHLDGIGTPILENWLSGKAIRPILRSIFLPALLVGLLVGVWRVVPGLPVFHPHRKSVDQVEDILKSSAGPKITEVVRRTSGRSIGFFGLAVTDLCGAISGELTVSLFVLSGFIWLLAKITRCDPREAPRTVLWLAIVLTISVGAIRYFAWELEFTRLLNAAVGVVWTKNDPLWLMATRLLVGSVPGGIALGWLYIRRGLESVMIAAVMASASGYLATTHLLWLFY